MLIKSIFYRKHILKLLKKSQIRNDQSPFCSTTKGNLGNKTERKHHKATFSRKKVFLETDTSLKTVFINFLFINKL